MSYLHCITTSVQRLEFCAHLGDLNALYVAAADEASMSYTPKIVQTLDEEDLLTMEYAVDLLVTL